MTAADKKTVDKNIVDEKIDEQSFRYFIKPLWGQEYHGRCGRGGGFGNEGALALPSLSIAWTAKK
jgi:hypothetical protein